MRVAFERLGGGLVRRGLDVRTQNDVVLDVGNAAGGDALGLAAGFRERDHVCMFAHPFSPFGLHFLLFGLPGRGVGFRPIRHHGNVGTRYRAMNFFVFESVTTFSFCLRSDAGYPSGRGWGGVRCANGGHSLVAVFAGLLPRMRCSKCADCEGFPFHCNVSSRDGMVGPRRSHCAVNQLSSTSRTWLVASEIRGENYLNRFLISSANCSCRYGFPIRGRSTPEWGGNSAYPVASKIGSSGRTSLTAIASCAPFIRGIE